MRINHAVADAKEVLLSSGNGWVMEYFPTNDQAGVTFLVKFNKDEMATMATVNEYVTTYTEGKGVWDVIADNGPVLTFNTFADIFHLYADPSSGLGKGLGLGLEGDYEFIIMKVSDDFIQLKGKKRGTDITLQRMGDNQDWKEYFTVLKSIDASLFNKNISVTLNLMVGDKAYTLQNGASHIFTATPVNAEETSDDEATVIEIPFIITTDGIRFAQAFKVGDESIRAFKLSDDKKYLYAVENPEARITSGLPLSFFLEESVWTSGISWLIDDKHLGGAFETAYTNVVSGCKTIYKEDFNSFFFKYKPVRGEKTLSFKSGTSKVYEGAYDFDISLKPGSTEEVVFTNKGKMDANGDIYLKNIPGFKEIIDLSTGSSFTVTTDAPLALSTLKFTSVSDSKNWFTVVAGK
jgi:hypothetical protein